MGLETVASEVVCLLEARWQGGGPRWKWKGAQGRGRVLVTRSGSARALGARWVTAQGGMPWGTPPPGQSGVYYKGKALQASYLWVLGPEP